MYLTIRVGMLMTELSPTWAKMAHNNVREEPIQSTRVAFEHKGFDVPEDVAKDKAACVAEILHVGGDVHGGLNIRIGSKRTERTLWLFIPGERTRIVEAMVGQW